ncbi:unnamed protein product [Moneuplotes crassus]|uniref:Uncharacterized protein n=1 Tax=Euplotes crassus TaxID=5936 RepID=A0AAD1UF31_EUPCR|nr:unnamed protein product [Moneuplotes crassus]
MEESKSDQNEEEKLNNEPKKEKEGNDGNIIVTGRWTNEEHIQFITCLKKYGKDWTKLENCVPTRTGPQVRSHAQKYFNRIKKEYQTEYPLEYINEFSKVPQDFQENPKERVTESEPNPVLKNIRESISSESKKMKTIRPESKKTVPSTMISTKYYSYMDSFKSPTDTGKDDSIKEKDISLNDIISTVKKDSDSEESNIIYLENGEMRINSNIIKFSTPCKIETIKINGEDVIMIHPENPSTIKISPVVLDTPIVINPSGMSQVGQPNQGISQYDQVI